VRWEDWESTDDLTIELDQPVVGQSENIIPRNWNSTWTYNIGGQYRLTETVALNAGYLYGKDCVPDSTFEPLIPDSDAHLFTLGTDLRFGSWTVSGAFGYEHHEDRSKDNTIGDPLSGDSKFTANGDYENDIYLIALSVGYKF
jgi:long-chain fatty acid transport protein